ncbi:hypothetical protein PIB30_054488 [Stylosanthes scabra]|uniref:Uncharacterized protein n=1 Tax=Stylosanthes scabra TaxID=79078 RepID=A0ABU6QJH9_9FABA|nr:hypothetical protein [Stylosanthes scabra]
MKGKSRKAGIGLELRAFLTQYTRVNERKHDRVRLQQAKFGAEVAKESAGNEKIAKKSLKAKSRAYAYAPKEPMRTHCHALGDIWIGVNSATLWWLVSFRENDPSPVLGIIKLGCISVELEKELAATKDQVDVLTAERDSALAAPLFKAKIDSLTEELRLAEGKKKVESFTRSLEQKHTMLDEAEAATGHWREEWKALALETGKMVQETFDILMDQVFHLNLAFDYSMIILDTRWDPKANRIYNPKAEARSTRSPRQRTSQNMWPRAT